MSRQEADRIMRQENERRRNELQLRADHDKEFPNGWTIVCGKEAGLKDFQVHVPDDILRLGNMVACLLKDWSEVVVRPNAPLTPHDRPIHMVEAVVSGRDSIPCRAICATCKHDWDPREDPLFEPCDFCEVEEGQPCLHWCDCRSCLEKKPCPDCHAKPGHHKGNCGFWSRAGGPRPGGKLEDA